MITYCACGCVQRCDWWSRWRGKQKKKLSCIKLAVCPDHPRRHNPLKFCVRGRVREFVHISSFMKIGWGVSEMWRVEYRPLSLTWPIAYTTACTTVQAVIKIAWYNDERLPKSLSLYLLDIWGFSIGNRAIRIKSLLIDWQHIDWLTQFDWFTGANSDWVEYSEHIQNWCRRRTLIIIITISTCSDSSSSLWCNWWQQSQRDHESA